MSEWAAHVLPHGPLEPLSPRLWRVEGTLPSFPLPRNMIVWRMDDGGLWLHSVVATDEPTTEALCALGPPRVMVVPSAAHRLDAGVYKARWPDLQVLAPERARAKVEAKLPVDATAEAASAEHGVTVHLPSGLRPIECTYEVDAGDGTRALVLNDPLFHLDHRPGCAGLLLRYITRSTGFFGVTGIGRWHLLADRRQFVAWLRAQADRGDIGVIAMSHGEPVRGLDACAAKLREAADRLA